MLSDLCNWLRSAFEFGRLFSSELWFPFSNRCLRLVRSSWMLSNPSSTLLSPGWKRGKLMTTNWVELIWVVRFVDYCGLSNRSINARVLWENLCDFQGTEFLAATKGDSLTEDCDRYSNWVDKRERICVLENSVFAEEEQIFSRYLDD